MPFMALHEWMKEVNRYSEEHQEEILAFWKKVNDELNAARELKIQLKRLEMRLRKKRRNLLRGDR